MALQRQALNQEGVKVSTQGDHRLENAELQLVPEEFALEHGMHSSDALWFDFVQLVSKIGLILGY